MKQHITPKQWNEVKEKQQTKFWRAVTIVCDSHDVASGSEDCDCSNPSIGQMIEFLEKHGHSIKKIIKRWDEWKNQPIELADNLWETCVEILK